MQLTDFPLATLHGYVLAIASAQEALLQSEQAARDWEMDYLAKVNQIDYAIAFDPELKNEQQRKAAKHEQMLDPAIGASISTLHHLQDEVKRKRIALELLQNQFTVAKLIERRAIFNAETTI